MESVDVVVVGAGVVGIAVARALALAGREVIVVEAAEGIGTETSSRNSEVVHAGIYYPKDSLMARFCVAGRRALYTYCDAHGVPYAKCGKLIVATSVEEDARLDGILARAQANGVEGMRRVSAAEAREMEPNLACSSALFSPETGIVDSHAYMLAMQGEAEACGAVFAFHAPVLGGRAVAGGVELDIGGAEPMSLRCRVVVNAAGLRSTEVARGIVGMPSQLVPRQYYARGCYFSLPGRSPFSRLIYPVPIVGGLGVHLTIDLGGQARFGPDVEWIDAVDYTVDIRRADSFYEAVRRYWPGLRDGALQPGYAGVRPKLYGEGEPACDFVLQPPAVHGVEGLVNLFGIESPGLTSAIAIGDHVAGLVG